MGDSSNGNLLLLQLLNPILPKQLFCIRPLFGIDDEHFSKIAFQNLKPLFDAFFLTGIVVYPREFIEYDLSKMIVLICIENCSYDISVAYAKSSIWKMLRRTLTFSTRPVFPHTIMYRINKVDEKPVSRSFPNQVIKFGDQTTFIPHA